MSLPFVSKKCIPCDGGAAPLDGDQLRAYAKELKTPWEIVGGKMLRREFEFGNFQEAMVFVNKVSDIAEREGHHPDIFISYDKVRIELTTHSIGELSENDFIIAAKIEAL